MTDSSGPFAPNPWGEAEWFDFAPAWARSGVIGTPTGTPTTGALAFGSSGLQVSAGTGRAWVRGAGFERTGTVPNHAVAPNAHATWSRRDRLIVRRDLANETVTTAVKQGTPAASPVAPSLDQIDGGVWEERLFSFLVPLNSGTVITGVEDERSWLTDTPIAGKMWKTGTPVGLTGAPTKLAMGGSRVGGGVIFDDANDELVLPCPGEFELALGGYVSSGSGDGYFGINRKRGGSDLMVLFGDFTKPADGDKRANAKTMSMPLAAGDRLSLQGVGPVGVNAYGTSEVNGCWLEVRYVGPLNGATPI